MKHLALSGVFIDPELIAFLTSKQHDQNIQSISLNNCFCHATTKDNETSLWRVEYDASQCPTWSSFFDCLVAQSPPKLTSFTISYDSWHLEHRMACYYEEGHDTEYCALYGSATRSQICDTLMAAAVLDADCRDLSRLNGVPCEKHVHRSLMLLYSDLHPERGIDGAATNFLWGTMDTCTRFLDGSDLESWKRLAELMVANGGRNVQMH